MSENTAPGTSEPENITMAVQFERNGRTATLTFEVTESEYWTMGERAAHLQTDEPWLSYAAEMFGIDEIRRTGRMVAPNA